MTSKETIKAEIATILGRNANELDDNAQLLDEVEDSLALVELNLELQDELGVVVKNRQLASVETVGDLVTLIATQKSSARKMPFEGLRLFS